MAKGALAGLKVVALEQAVAAPYCTSRLADAGAEVIKIERAEGDFARSYDADVKGESAYFVWLNRGKKSVVLDIKNEDDAALLHKLIADSDIFVQNLVPGATERAGFGSAELCSMHPRLIACDISGYGPGGPYEARKAYDLLIQCETGLASITGTPDAPGRVGISVCDIACGMYAHAAILEALVARSVSGQGRHIQISLFGAMADWMTVPLLQYDFGGRPGVRVGIAHATIAPYGAFTSADGVPIVLGIQNVREWERFANFILARPDMVSDPMFATNNARVANRGELDATINAIFATMTAETIMLRLIDADIAHAALNGVGGLSSHPQLNRVTVQTAAGAIDMPAPAGGGDKLGNVPKLGEHSQEVRSRYIPARHS